MHWTINLEFNVTMEDSNNPMLGPKKLNAKS